MLVQEKSVALNYLETAQAGNSEESFRHHGKLKRERKGEMEELWIRTGKFDG